MKLKPEKEVLVHLSFIETHINAYLANRASIKTGLIETQLTNMCSDGTRFNVRIASQNVSKKPFVMCIYPDPEELAEMSKPLVKRLHHDKYDDFIEAWAGIKKWTIEIDERTISKNSPICVDNGRQFCALLCHELNHAVYTHPSHLVVNYKFNKARLDMYSKMLSDKKSVCKLFLPMFVCVDGLRIVVSKPGKTLQEMEADLHVPAAYKPDMIEYMSNHVISNPLIMSDTIKTNEEFDHEQNSGVMFTAECIRQMKQRRAMVKLELDAQYKLSPNGYFKEILAKTIEGIDGKCPDKEKSDKHRDEQRKNRVDLVKEARALKDFNDDIKATDKEYKTYQISLESRTVDDKEIILLTSEIDSITTTYDKTYALNRAFDLLEVLKKQRQTILDKTRETDPKKLEALTKDVDLKIERVNALITTTMSKNVSYGPEHYGLFVKYPAGYEG